MHLQSGLGRKRILVYLEPENGSNGCRCRSPPLGELTVRSPSPLAVFEGPFQGEGKEGETRRREEKERRKRDGRKHSRNTVLFTALLIIMFVESSPVTTARKTTLY